MGFGVAKPWGDSRRYYFILDNGCCLPWIQFFLFVEQFLVAKWTH
jgi:hypothetical protein